MLIFPKTSMITVTAGVILIPDLALAHLGHFGDLAGHSHWIGLAGLAAAGAGAMLWGAWKDGKQTSDDADDSLSDATADAADDAEDSEVPA